MNRGGSARGGPGWSKMQPMTLLQRGETSVGPVAVDGRTITLVARTTAVHIGSDERGALHLRSRPVHVEVLDADGRRHIVRIRDIENRRRSRRSRSVAAVCACAMRISRRTEGGT